MVAVRPQFGTGWARSVSCPLLLSIIVGFGGSATKAHAQVPWAPGDVAAVLNTGTVRVYAFDSDPLVNAYVQKAQITNVVGSPRDASFDADGYLWITSQIANRTLKIAFDGGSGATVITTIDHATVVPPSGPAITEAAALSFDADGVSPLIANASRVGTIGPIHAFDSTGALVTTTSLATLSGFGIRGFDVEVDADGDLAATYTIEQLGGVYRRKLFVTSSPTQTLVSSGAGPNPFTVRLLPEVIAGRRTFLVSGGAEISASNPSQIRRYAFDPAANGGLGAYLQVATYDVADPQNWQSVALDATASTLWIGSARSQSNVLYQFDTTSAALLNTIPGVVDPVNALSAINAVALCGGFRAAVPPNEPPVAIGVCEQLTSIGNQARVRLDGTGSSDPEGAELEYAWAVTSGATTVFSCVGAAATCAVVEADLDYGVYTVTLRVTDPSGAFDELSKSLALDPAELVSFDAEKAVVRFNPGRVELRGELGLPFGVDYSELTPIIAATLDLGGQSLLSVASTAFTAEGPSGQRWRFLDADATSGVTRFDVNWSGARYLFKESGFPVELRSQIITSSETILSLKLKPRQISAPFTIAFDGVPLVTVDADGMVVADPAIGVDEEKPGKEYTLTLPQPLVDTTLIEFAGSLVRTLNVGDNLKGSVGRYRLQVRFDPESFPDGDLTTPRGLDLEVLVGGPGYPGFVSLDEEDLEVGSNVWRN
ncbi:MAG: hypothetical protein AB7O52_05405 [Planctomycetota bacterium]